VHGIDVHDVLGMRLQSSFPHALRPHPSSRRARPHPPCPASPCPLQVREVIKMQNENPNMKRLRDGSAKLGNLQDLRGQRVLASPRSPLPSSSPDSYSSPPAFPPPTDSSHLPLPFHVVVNSAESLLGSSSGSGRGPPGALWDPAALKSSVWGSPGDMRAVSGVFST